jgi:CheY-like chemotaxis protein
VLIVEDDDDSRAVTGELLELLGKRPKLAKDASEALAHVAEQVPDVALIDLSLPGMDGCELARRLRSQVGAQIRLIALTGHSDPGLRKQAAAAGFDDYWLKPVAAEVFDRLFERDAEREAPLG